MEKQKHKDYFVTGGYRVENKIVGDKRGDSNEHSDSLFCKEAAKCMQEFTSDVKQRHCSANIPQGKQPVER